MPSKKQHKRKVDRRYRGPFRNVKDHICKPDNRRCAKCPSFLTCKVEAAPDIIARCPVCNQRRVMFLDKTSGTYRIIKGTQKCPHRKSALLLCENCALKGVTDACL